MWMARFSEILMYVKINYHCVDNCKLHHPKENFLPPLPRTPVYTISAQVLVTLINSWHESIILAYQVGFATFFVFALFSLCSRNWYHEWMTLHELLSYPSISLPRHSLAQDVYILLLPFLISENLIETLHSLFARFHMTMFLIFPNLGSVSKRYKNCQNKHDGTNVSTLPSIQKLLHNPDHSIETYYFSSYKLEMIENTL